MEHKSAPQSTIEGAVEKKCSLPTPYNVINPNYSWYFVMSVQNVNISGKRRDVLARNC